MKEYVFIKSVHCYADEFDTHEVAVWELSRYNAWKEALEKAFIGQKDIEMYFGSNEFLIFNSAAEVLEGITVKPVTEDEANVLKKYLFDYGDTFGTGPVLGYEFDEYEDEELS